MSTFICHPEGSRPHPTVIFFMDAAGIRLELREMARRIAHAGYFVMLPNLYYRLSGQEFGPLWGEQGAPALKRAPDLMDSLTIPGVMADTKSLLAFADSDEAAAEGPVGCVGYCMSGQYAITAAAAFPERVTAAASIYGVRLVTGSTNSPHIAAGLAKGRLYFAWAEIDQYAPLEWIEPIRKSMRDGGVNGEVEIYRGAEHGFAFPSRSMYDLEASERHWSRLIDLFGTNLRSSAERPHS